MQIDDKQLYIRGLKPAFLVNNYISGFKKYRYEDYLLEFINNSKFFVYHGNEKFVAVTKQDKGEPDAKNSKYELDFKIFAEEKNIHAKSELGEQISVAADGITCYEVKQSKYKEICYFNLLKLFRNREKDDTNNEHLNQRNNALKTAYKILGTKKNIFILLPFEFLSINNTSAAAMIEIISNEMKSDLKMMMEYRKTKTQKDMFISFVWEKTFIIINCSIEDPTIYDIVPIESSQLFYELYELSNDIFN